MNKGFIAFTSLLIIAAIALASVLSISLLGIGEARSSLDNKKGQEVKILANSCVQEALYQLRNFPTYSGGNLNMENGTCNISLTSSGNLKTIIVEAQVNDPSVYIKTLKVQAYLVGNSVSLNSWEEVN